VPLVTSAVRGWTESLAALVPGDHAAILSGTSATGIVGRLAGLELRDVLSVLLPGPATGFVFLFRKPLAASTVASQMLATGTGGLNIAGCRVGLTGGTRRSGQAQHLLNDDGTEDRSHHWARTGHTVVEVSEGRWPPNVLLVHTPTCRQVGTRRVKGDPRTANGAVPAPRQGGFVDVGALTPNSHPSGRVYGDKDGQETVPEWDCGPHCPVMALDAMTGLRPSTLGGRADPNGLYANPGDNHGTSLFGGGNSAVYADEGGASRYYPQFEGLDALIGWLSELVGKTT